MTDSMWLGVLGLPALLLLVAFHVPVGVAMALVGVVGVGILIGFEPAFALLSIEPSAAMASEGLAIIALFLLMGNLAHAGGISADLFRLAHVFVGHRRGGLVFATIAASAGFGAVCGSSIATAATMVRVALPEMLERGYARSLAAGTIAAGGTLGMIIPPSLVLILYGVLTETSIIALFLAAVVPGILAVVFNLGAVAVLTRARPEIAPRGIRESVSARRKALRQSGPALTLITAMMLGIYGGIFTVPEAAAVGSSVTLLLVLINRRLSLRGFLTSLSETAANTGMIFIIIIGASIFSYFAALSGLPTAIVDGINSLGLSAPLVLIGLLLFYLMLGSVLDTIAAMVITLPVAFPLVISMGYDPVWWGVINVVVIEMGMITPPFGINVFVLHGMARDLPLGEVYRGVLPFLAADLLRLALLVSLPALSLWLPETLGWL